MHKDYLSLINGKSNLWKRLMLDYPAKLEKELTEEDKELQVFLFYGVMALDTCFDPTGEEKLFDLDIYQLDSIYVILAYNNMVESLLCFYFLDHGYHPNLVKRFCEIRSNLFQESGIEESIHDLYKEASSMATITRECFLSFVSYFNIPETKENALQLYCILQTFYKQIKLGLRKDDKSSTQDLSLLKQGYELDNKSSC